MSSLSFYRPGFLWGLLFLAAIFCFHLLRRPPRRVLDFSTLRFFNVRALKTSRMRRLRRLLLLLSRLAAVATIVFLFAQPFDAHDPLNVLQNPHLTAFIWIDRTPSMDYTEGGRSLLNRAESLADSMVTALPSTVRHLRYDEATDGFSAYDPAVAPKISTRHGPPRLDRVFRAWSDSRGGCSLPLLVLLSDFQKSTSAQLDTILRRAFPFERGTPRIIGVNLSPHSPWNYSVMNVRVLASGKISATVAAHGKNLDSAVLSVTAASIRVARQTVSLKAGDTITAESSAAGGALNVYGGSAALDAPDPLAFDNVNYFVSRGRKALHVCIIGERDRNFPLAAAFSASGHDAWNPVTVRKAGAVTFDELDSAEVIIINAVSRMSRPLEALSSGLTAQGKTVVCAFEDSGEGFGVCASFASKVNRSHTLLRPVSLTDPAAVVIPDTLSETWKGFPSLRTEASSIYRYVSGLPGTVLARLDNGTPLVTHIAAERGGSFLFVATPLGLTEANNLCETGFYTPFIDRITRYAANRRRISAPVFTAGFESRNPLYGSGKKATVFSEDGKTIDRWHGQPAVLFKQPGLYKIVPDGDKPYRVPVNAHPAENILDYSLAAMHEETKSNLLILKEKEFEKCLMSQGGFRSFLPWLLLILFLLAETLLWESPPPLPDNTGAGTRKPSFPPHKKPALPPDR